MASLTKESPVILRKPRKVKRTATFTKIKKASSLKKLKKKKYTRDNRRS